MIFKHKKLLTLSEQIAEHIKDAIINRQLHPGDKLPSEQELAEHFKVSRPTIRDAIKLLAASKLVITKSGAKGGHFVSEINPDSFIYDFSDYITLSLNLRGISLEEVIEMREMVEIKACSLAALRRTEEELLTLKELLPSKDTHLSDQLYYQQDFEFHRAIAKATHNRLIIITIEAISSALSPFFNSVDCPVELKNELTEELHEIYKAIKQQDPDLAAEKMSYHLRHFVNHFSTFDVSP